MYDIVTGHMGYSDIIKAGYGILSTVKDTRLQTENALYKKSVPILDSMIKYGTTTVEGKSGYGLTVKDEIKILKKLYPIKYIDSYIISSSRRFEKNGIIKTIICMQKLQHMFRKGYDIEKIADIYNNMK